MLSTIEGEVAHVDPSPFGDCPRIGTTVLQVSCCSVRPCRLIVDVGQWFKSSLFPGIGTFLGKQKIQNYDLGLSATL